jgi:UDP-glucose 4-epimerase
MGKKQVSYKELKLRFFITGCAGFIGSNLTDRLLQYGHKVVGYDNFSTGQQKFIEIARQSSFFRFVHGDMLDLEGLTKAMLGSDFVFHMAANADVRFGTEHPRKDLEQNIIATFNVLEAMRANGICRIAFASTSSVYGEPQIFPTMEDAPFPVQTSLYGASKLAGEGLIEAYCEGFGFQGYIFRFVSILGERYTHGHVFDFYKSLCANPHELHVLGNGKQRKSYLYVQDCIDAMLLAIEKAQDKVNLFNLGVDEYCEVNDSIGWITQHFGLTPKVIYAGGERGWIGDNPFIFLDCAKIRALGWQPKLSIREGVIRTVEYLQANPWVMKVR